MRLKLAFFIILPLACLIPFQVRAQAQPGFDSLTVDLWPEFDRPSMLVMYVITLSPEVKLPAEIRLRIPASAGAPHAVATCQPDGGCFNAPYVQNPAGEWSEVVFQATLPDLRVEFYDPLLIKEGAKRHYEFNWPGDYAVQSYQIRVQQPSGAENMLVKPGTASRVEAADGFTYHTLDVGAVPAGQTVKVVIDYNKATDELSSSSMPVQPSEPLSGEIAGRTSLISALPFVLGLVGLALIIGGGVWYWRSGRQAPQPERSRRSRRRATSVQVSTGVAEGNVYCHQCGRRAVPGDRFCRTCGTQLRTGN